MLKTAASFQRTHQQLQPMEERINSAESVLRHPGPALRSWWREARMAVPLGYQLAKRDIQAKYRQTLLGYIWALLPAVATTLAFTFMRSTNLLNTGDTQIPYPLYAFLGAMFWQLFSNSLLQPMTVVQASKSILSKVQFPREALLVSAVLLVAIDFLINMSVLPVVFLAFGAWPGWDIFLLPAIVAATVVAGMAIGILLVPLNLIFQDTRMAVQMVLSFMILITPIGYVTPAEGWLRLLVTLNPMSALIEAGRASLTSLPMPAFASWGPTVGGSCVLLLVALAFYLVALPIVVERQSA
jgi:lipopolysaccharide transport system permease protein